MPGPEIQPETNWREQLAAYIAIEASPREKYGHQPRLYALTRTLAAGLEYDDDVVYAAAWLHDLGVFTGHRPEDPVLLTHWDNVAYAVERAPHILASFSFPHSKLDAVLECIRHHQPACEPQTIESTILRDADILEQLGAVGILRTVCKIGRDTRFPDFSAAALNLRQALDRLPAKLLLPSSRALAADRIRLLGTFLNAVDDEAGDLLF